MVEEKKVTENEWQNSLQLSSVCAHNMLSLNDERICLDNAKYKDIFPLQYCEKCDIAIKVVFSIKEKMEDHYCYVQKLKHVRCKGAEEINTEDIKCSYTFFIPCPEMCNYKFLQATQVLSCGVENIGDGIFFSKDLQDVVNKHLDKLPNDFKGNKIKINPTLIEKDNYTDGEKTAKLEIETMEENLADSVKLLKEQIEAQMNRIKSNLYLLKQMNLNLSYFHFVFEGFLPFHSFMYSLADELERMGDKVWIIDLYEPERIVKFNLSRMDYGRRMDYKKKSKEKEKQISDYTVGKMYIKSPYSEEFDYFCDTLEDKDRGLKNNFEENLIKKIKIERETAIPRGIYSIRKVNEGNTPAKFKQTFYSLFHDTYKLDWYVSKVYKMDTKEEVIGYTAILIHQGVNPLHTDGCILLGKVNEEAKGELNYYETVKKYVEFSNVLRLYVDNDYKLYLEVTMSKEMAQKSSEERKNSIDSLKQKAEKYPQIKDFLDAISKTDALEDDILAKYKSTFSAITDANLKKEISKVFAETINMKDDYSNI